MGENKNQPFQLSLQLDTSGGESSDAAAPWNQAEENRGVTIASGIGKPWIGADGGDAGGSEGKSV